MMNRIMVIVLSLATTIALAYGLFGAGLLVCTTDSATRSIGSTFSSWDRSVFPEEDMATIAEATRAFAVEGTESDALYDTIRAVIEKNYPALADVLSAGSIEGVDEARTLRSLLGSSSLATLTERYSLPQDALSHLSDCTTLFTTVRISIGVVGVMGILGLFALGFLRGRRGVGCTLMAAGSIVLIVLVGLGAWAIVDFNSLFTLMHSLFFARGSWLFDADSLLIQLFPEAFWVAMAALWAIVSITISILAVVVGRLVRG